MGISSIVADADVSSLTLLADRSGYRNFDRIEAENQKIKKINNKNNERFNREIDRGMCMVLENGIEDLTRAGCRLFFDGFHGEIVKRRKREMCEKIWQ